MNEFVIEGETYRAGKIPAMTQFHIARRLAPVLSRLPGLPGAEGGVSATALPALAEAIAGLSDDDCEYVIGNCMGVVQRQSKGVWTPAWNATAKRAMYDDITMPVMLQIAMRVLMDALGGFLPAPLSSLDGGAPQAAP